MGLQEDLFPVVVGRNDGTIEPVRFRALKGAENYIAHLEKEDPEGVHAGEYYIDAPEEMVNE